ncbi:MAG TPA: LytTR family DNA-binding domain-containing protein [Flavobacteriales bacterium]|nr:LytTR family DNA-binding domain-containing protein [Flavobacteriales bacterium]
MDKHSGYILGATYGHGKADDRDKCPSEKDLEACYVREEGTLYRVPFRSILSLSAQGNRVGIAADGHTYTINSSLTEVQAQLDDPRFVQVNRNTVVNMERVARVDHDCIVMENNEEFTLSRNYRQSLIEGLGAIVGK